MGFPGDNRNIQPGQFAWQRSLSRLPWWVLILFIGGAFFVYILTIEPRWNNAYDFIKAGIQVTLILTLSSFAIALLLGLMTGLGQLSQNILIRNISLLYIQVVRGIPLLVQLIFVAFVLVPEVVIPLINFLGSILQALPLNSVSELGVSLFTLRTRDVDMIYRAIAGLAFGYGAFEAEVFRAGIESIERGQMEAARSLGMSYGESMRYIILPQAIRVVLPPLGNDFIAMLKDSSLVSALATRELTHLMQLHRARAFRSWEALGTVAFLYLILTLSLSLIVKLMERRLAVEK